MEHFETLRPHCVESVIRRFFQIPRSVRCTRKGMESALRNGITQTYIILPIRYVFRHTLQ